MKTRYTHSVHIIWCGNCLNLLLNYVFIKWVWRQCELKHLHSMWSTLLIYNITSCCKFSLSWYIEKVCPSWPSQLRSPLFTQTTAYMSSMQFPSFHFLAHCMQLAAIELEQAETASEEYSQLRWDLQEAQQTLVQLTNGYEVRHKYVYATCCLQ